MAPAQPSAQDRAVAAQAMQLMLQAQSELAVEGEGAESGASGRDAISAEGASASSTYRDISNMAGPDTASPGFSAVA